MAVTGLLMVLWVIGHLLGNLTIFAGPNGINAYAAKLHEMGPLLWGTRVVMGAAVVLHLVLGLKVWLENRAAKPTDYVVRKKLRATVAGRTMIYTGALLALFIGLHLAQFTFHATPDVVVGTDTSSRFDVFIMVMSSLAIPAIAIGYVAAMVMLFLHLRHGIQSTFQTLGLSTAKTLPQVGALGKVISAIFLVGFGSIPVLILFERLVQ